MKKSFMDVLAFIMSRVALPICFISCAIVNIYTLLPMATEKLLHSDDVMAPYLFFLAKETIGNRQLKPGLLTRDQRVIKAIKDNDVTCLSDKDRELFDIVYLFKKQTAGLPDEEKVAAATMLICERCSYLDSPVARTSYDVLVKGKALCEGYSRATRLLLTAAGIDCRLVQGLVQGGGHMWNIAEINYYSLENNNNPYSTTYAYIDTTFFDSDYENNCSEINLLLTEDAMKNHDYQWVSTIYPECNVSFNPLSFESGEVMQLFRSENAY